MTTSQPNFPIKRTKESTTSKKSQSLHNGNLVLTV